VCSTPLGLAGDRSVEDEQRIFRMNVIAGHFGRHLLAGRGTEDRARGHQSTGRARALLTTTTQSHAVVLEIAGVDIGLQRHFLAAAQPLVGG